MLTNDRIDEILSSPYVRCVQTVDPLAAARKLPVETTKELQEGAGGESIIRLTRKHSGHNVVLCTHGDVVEELLELLIKDGLAPRSGAQLEKGSTWVLEEQDGRITGAKYRPAP